MHTRKILTLTIVLALAGCTAGRSGTATKYRPMSLFGGYKDQLVEPGVWRVTGRSNGIAEQGYGQNVAVYRAAKIVKAAGFSHLQIIDQKGKQRFVGVGYGTPTDPAGESMELLVRGANSAEPPNECREKKADACFTLNVDETMNKVRPFLTFPGDGSSD